MNWPLRIVVGLVACGFLFLAVDQVQRWTRRGPYRGRRP